MQFHQMNFNMQEAAIVQQQATQICAEHSGCVDCPLVAGRQMQIGQTILTCETGKGNKC